jgi:hypothetical protein
MKLNCLVACEQSQEVTEQLIKLGHNAMSCDIQYDGEKGLPHYKGDVRDLLQERYDLVVFHPVCKYIANSGVRWLYDADGRQNTRRWMNLISAMEFFKPTNIVGPPPKDKAERNRWQDCWMASPGPDRERLRSKTYTGIAEAIAKQYTEHIIHIRTTSLKLVDQIQNIHQYRLNIA